MRVTARKDEGADRLCCTCTAGVAVPTTPDDNPWARKGDDWNP